MADLGSVTVVNCYGDSIDATVSRYDERSVQVSAPGYISRRVVLDFNPKTADVVLLMMNPKTAQGPKNIFRAVDPLAWACTLNIRAVMTYTSACGERLLDYLCYDEQMPEPIKAAQDRCYWRAPGGVDLAKALDRTGAFKRVPSKLHNPHEEGFEVVGSWKTTRGAPDLQITLWRWGNDYIQSADMAASDSPARNFVAELDIDLRTGTGHVFEVARNAISGGKTHPYAVNQMLSFYWGIIPFRLEPGE